MISTQNNMEIKEGILKKKSSFLTSTRNVSPHLESARKGNKTVTSGDGVVKVKNESL